MLTPLLAHQDAFERCNILHRDISTGNILIYKKPNTGGEVEGLLIDWDLSQNVQRMGKAWRKGRMVRFTTVDLISWLIVAQGTWEFMSARMLLKEKGFVHELRDDLESFVHVLHYTVCSLPRLSF